MPIEWYERHAKDVAAALTKAKSADKDNAVSCTLVKSTEGTFLLCAHVAAAKATAMVKETRSHGAKVVAAGTLYKGDDGLTFALTEGSEAVKKQFSDAAAVATGKPLSVVVIGLTKTTSESHGTEGGESPPLTEARTADGAAAFKARAATLAAAVKAAAPEIQSELQPRLVQAVGLGNAGKYAEAGPLLDGIEHRLATPPVGAEMTTEADKLQLTERLKAIKSRYLEVLQSNPPNKVVLEKARATVVQATKDGNFAMGRKVLDGLEKAVLASSTAGKASTVPLATFSLWSDALDTVRGALTALEGKLRQSNDADLIVIADKGLKKLFEQLPDGVAAALQAVDSGKPDAHQQAGPVLAKVREFLTSDKLIDEVDANPFEVEVGIRDKLVGTLQSIEKTLRAAT